MKKLLILVVGIVFATASCTGIKTVTKGIENESFLVVFGDAKIYEEGVDVILDNQPSFKAEVSKANNKLPRETKYTIPTGKHKLEIKFKNKTLYSKTIFTSSQETKTITLP
jgi:hypothetical protein